MNDWLNLLTLFAQEEAKKPQPNPFQAMLVPFLIIGFLWYFLILRPQQKQRQRRDTQLDALKKNDVVVTIGGIVGTVTNLTTEFVTIRVDDNTKLKMLRDSIRGPLKETADDPDSNS